MEVDVGKMAEDLGNSLINRAKKFLDDEVDPAFLKEIALDMATTQARALAAKTAEEAQLAEEDLAFMRGRISTFIARESIKVRSEFQEAFEEVLETVGDIIEVLGKAAINIILNRGTDG